MTGRNISACLIWAFGRDTPAKLIKERKSYVMLEIRRPFPTTLRPRKRSQHYRRWYFPPLVTLWRMGDQVTIQFWPWLHLRRWLFTRCEGCGRRFPYGSGACVARMEWVHRGNTKSIMLGEPGLYHFDCPANPVVEYSSTQEWDRQWGHDDGLRRHVLGEPVDVALELSMLAGARRDAEQRYRKRLVESRRELGYDQFQWKVRADES